MSKKLLTIPQAAATVAFAASLLFQTMSAHAKGPVPLSGGDLLKLPDDGNPATTVDTAIYYYGIDGLRYVFPNSKTYFTWYSDFRGVKVIDMVQLGTIGIGGNVTYRPASKMIKIDSDPKVYAIDRRGTRRLVKDEATARALFGTSWNKKIDDVPDAFFSNYPEGGPVNSAADFLVSTIFDTYRTIGIDRGLSAPVEVAINFDGTFTPPTVTITAGQTVRWTNNSNGTFRLASNPHPVHSDLAGFDSAFIPLDFNYVYRFRGGGNFGYHNHANPSLQGAVVVNQ